MINLDDWKEEMQEALSEASAFVKRSKASQRVDRWASERQMWLVAKGIEARDQIIEWLKTSLNAANRALEEVEGELGKAQKRIDELQAEIERLREYIDSKASPDDGQQS